MVGGAGILAFLGTWAGLFLLISAAVNSYSLTLKVKRGRSPLKVLKYQILAGVGLLIAAFFAECFTGYYGAFGNLFKHDLGEFEWDSGLSRIFEFETLNTIGYSIIILGLIQFFLIQEGGVKKYKRNSLIFLVLAIITVALTPLVWDIAEFVYPGWNNGQRDWPPTSFEDFILRYIFSALTGSVEPLFPFMATAFIGSIIGTALAQDNPDKNILWQGALGGIITIGFGILFIFPPFGGKGNYFGEFEFTAIRPRVSMYLLGTGFQILTTIFFLWIAEFRGVKNSFITIK
ncbi:MAG: hypothetical protein U9O98_05300 [Asgard group archaeon]|nr:hypothetical protein [Asgard group archaeon]